MAAVPPPIVSVIIPVRNDATRLKRCLESILCNEYPRDRLEVVVADNGSTDGSGAVATAMGALVVRHPQARAAELRNEGARLASGDVLAFVDADHEVADRWISAAVDGLSEPGVAASGAPYLPPVGANWVQRTYDTLRWRTIERRDVEWLASGNMVVRRSAFEQAGGFDARLTSCEDIELCRRLRALGYRVVSDPRLESRHNGDPDTLRSVFAGELWRGRDNLRVSVRPPFSLRSVATAGIPVVELALIAAALAGLLSGRWRGFAVAAGAALAILGLVSLRAMRMMLAGGSRSPAQVVRALAVACAYDLGRALALVARATHRTRQIHGVVAR